MSTLAVSAGYDPSGGVLGPCVESFTTELSNLGYSALTMRRKRATAASFVRWTVQRRLDVASIDESTIEAFLEQSGRRPTPSRVRRAALASFLEHLRSEGKTIRPEPEREHSQAELVQERYESYLRIERGVTETTVISYRPFVRDFVRRYFVGTAAVDPASALSAQAVQDFLVDRTRSLRPRRAQLLTTALRSFLRFLFLRAEVSVDLSTAVPTVRRLHQATVHPYLHPDEVERLLGACDRTTPLGRRDHAILLLLARLGLRAGEVAALEIGDVRWRSGEILVRGKGQVLECLPLLPEVGTALALYVQHDRSESSCRRIFLRNDAPRIGLRPGTVGSVVRRALARAELRPPLRGAHLLRFSLATTMIRRGASMAEIGEVLRHHSPDTTEIYAKVDFEALRAVAMPWPDAGGAR